MIDHSLHSDLNIAETLRDLLTPGASLLISKGWDGEYTANIGPNQKCTSETLEGCLEGLTGRVRMKICIRENCKSRGYPKVLSCFTPDNDTRDGHSSVCKLCEGKRVQVYLEKKKKKKQSIAAPGHQDEMGEAFG